jgi:hypothetical protein
VISNAKEVNAQMVKSFNRKFKETDMSVASVKRHKANTGKLGNPRTSFQRDPPSYQAGLD